MDTNSSNKKHGSTNIPYVRTHDDSSNVCKQNHGSNFIFQYRTSFIGVLFSTLLVGCFIMIVVYFNMQTDRYPETLQVNGKLPHSSYVQLDVDPDTKAAVIELASENELFMQNMPFLQDEVDTMTRQKRQAQFDNRKDCTSQQKNCRKILKVVQEMTKTMSNQLEHLKDELIEQNILNADDSRDVNYRKIYECLQCKNVIDHKQEEEVEDSENQADVHISDVLPYFDEQHDAEDDEQEKLDKKDQKDMAKGDERTERGITKQIMESMTNSSKMSGGAKITEILFNTTIVEKDQDAPNGGQGFHHRPVDMGTRGGESHVTRNMQGIATPMIMPTAETTMMYQQQDPFGRPIDKQIPAGLNNNNNNNANIPSGLHPFILPTAESTKYSQQIQITPQANPSLIPVCFYKNPPSGAPQQPFYTPHSLPQGINLGPANQQIKFFPPNGASFQSGLPAQFLHSSSAQGAFSQPAFPMMNQAPERESPVYCTYIPMPNMQPQQQQQQQQGFTQVPTMSSYQSPFAGRAKGNKPKPKEKVASGKGPSANAKSTYDESDEKYFFNECNGFTCPPPYMKCIAQHQRCDGRVDCMGAEDEIGCPVIEDTYYSRFMAQVPPNEPMTIEDLTKKITTYMATTVYPIIETTDTNDLETTTIRIAIPEMAKHFKCKRIVQTVSLGKRCDGVFDCEDASDEEGCTCKDYLLQQRPFAVCDGHVDCSDGTDEQGCNFCRNDEYHCHRSGSCIPRQKMCNQETDCKLNEDELDCFVLTDGKRVNLDLDRRPHLNLAGVLTRYEGNAWRATCFKSEYRRSESKRMAVAQRICEYLGFRSVDTANEVIVPKSKLEERSSTTHSPISYEYPPQFSPMSKGDNNTCYGLYISCKPILNTKVNTQLKIKPENNERSYIWPWEGSIYADGEYQCPGVLLEKNLLLASSKCSEHIDLAKNYTTAAFGVSSPELPYSGPYQQTSQVVDITPIKNSEASLFRLKDNINMTRYVQPVYMEKRIFPAAKNDSCVALGVTDKGERKMKFLQPVVDNCPKCHRCYFDKSDTSCSRINETTNWSGNIVCLSGTGGWYPTAVFQDKDQDCGFSKKQTLNSIDYIHAHLSEAIDEHRSSTKEAQCNGVRCALGECIPYNRVCDGIRDCRDGADEDPNTCMEYSKRCEENVSECKCSQAELRCGNGKCVPKEKFCDGKNDCEDGSDEPATCTCAEYLKLTKPKLVCDNRRHCLDKSDEDYRYCHCKDNSFKCHKSRMNGTTACVSPDVVCDGHPDCPAGEDESEEACNTIKKGRFDPRGKGELQKRSYGEWQSVCWPEPAKSQAEVQAACAKMGYKTGLLLDGTKATESVYVPRNDFYMFQPNNHTWVTMRQDEPFGMWVRPNTPCYRLFIQCY